MATKVLERVVAAATLVSLLSLAGIGLKSLSIQQQMVEGSIRQQRISALAAEIRRSSTTLSSLARDYVVTGEPQLRERYHQVWNRRADQRGRPAEPLDAATAALLAESLRRSEGLAQREVEVMSEVAALLGRGVTDIEQRTHLIERLHDAEYQAQKQAMLDAASRFEDTVHDRGAVQGQSLRQALRHLLLAALGIVAVLLIGALLLIAHLRRAFVAPLESLIRAARGVSWADYSARAVVEGPNELGLLAATFNHMAATIENDLAKRERMQARLERMATCDELTGLPNRRAFMKHAKAELRRAARYGRNIAVLVLDVDHFKGINDRYGHAAGDCVLRDLGQLLSEQVRDADVVGRLGGEEFGLVLPELDGDAAVQAAERLRVEIADSTVEGRAGIEIPYTVSIGVAAMGGGAEDLEVLLQRADAALRNCAQDGRNRVGTWEQARRKTHPSSIVALTQTVGTKARRS